MIIVYSKGLITIEATGNERATFDFIFSRVEDINAFNMLVGDYVNSRAHQKVTEDVATIIDAYKAGKDIAVDGKVVKIG